MIVILDFGSQTTHLIHRRIKALGVAARIADPAAFKPNQVPQLKGLILSGGPASVTAENSPDFSFSLSQINAPVLGICYGWQLIAKKLKGEVTAAEKEYGPAQMKIKNKNLLFDEINQNNFKVWMSHGDLVKKIPSGFQYLASTDDIAAAAVANNKKQIYGLQFHPEVEHTKFGQQILRNFIEKICGLTVREKQLDVNKVVQKIKNQLAHTEGKIVAAVSGGVDSTVASAIAAKAVGKRLVPIYCDNGLMRLRTDKYVKKVFKDYLQINPVIVDCRAEFLKALQGVIDPEKKRKNVGKLYIDIFEREAKKLKNVQYLVQGTIYSDVIESKGSKNASKIKSHHNVGGLPEKMSLKLIEPLRNFYKDEVRELGRQLGLPDEVVNCQPFPGPGHAIRIIGEVTADRLKKQQQADQIVIDVLTETGWFNKVFQSFPIMTGVQTTAVKGDERAFSELVGLRIYNSTDVMTAGWTRLPYDILQKISSRIVNEIPDVSRVAYDITTKPPATMEWE